jgi:hypothetical protein
MTGMEGVLESAIRCPALSKYILSRLQNRTVNIVACRPVAM